jgi:membrane associated rhomboid family serine protease
MSEGQQKLGGMPRPGPGLKIALIALAAVALASAILGHWVPGDTGPYLVSLLPMAPHALAQGQVWRLATSGLFTADLGHLFFSALGLYFLSPDLEKAMGKWRFLRFLLTAVIAGNLLGVAVDALPVDVAIFHPKLMFGPGAAIAATAIAWSKANARVQVRLFFLLPVSGKQLYYATIGLCLLSVVFFQSVPEGVVAPFGGILTGILLSGQPSPARAAYLRLKLFFLRRQTGHISAESLLKDPGEAARARARRKGGPELRVVLGGLEDKIKDQPPKDKRFLN